jgi:hypothetical protein
MASELTALMLRGALFASLVDDGIATILSAQPSGDRPVRI